MPLGCLAWALMPVILTSHQLTDVSAKPVNLRIRLMPSTTDIRVSGLLKFLSSTEFATPEHGSLVLCPDVSQPGARPGDLPLPGGDRIADPLIRHRFDGVNLAMIVCS
jgi:hypothetical protein